jgi:hypothetical protein
MTRQNPAQCMDLEPGNPMMLHLVPRLGKTALVPLVFPLTPGFTIHSVCAFERAADAQGKRSLELYSTAWESEAVAQGRVKGGLLGSWEGAGNNNVYCTVPCLMYCIYRAVQPTPLIPNRTTRPFQQTDLCMPHPPYLPLSGTFLSCTPALLHLVPQPPTSTTSL